MCGIVGYIGQEDSKEILLKGLEKLEYRGYDSAGIAVANGNGVTVFREKGRIADLRTVVDTNVHGSIGIGHTRWATHGVPSVRNAHPHQSVSQRFTLVHNGVIENYEELKRNYLVDVDLSSDTDTEIVVQMIEKLAKEMPVEVAFRETLKKLQGSYAIAMIDNQNPEVLYAAKNKSPMLAGVGEGFNVIASDAMAMLQVTNEYIELMDQEYLIITKEDVNIKTIEGNPIVRKSFKPEIDASDIEKGTYPHYMLKEIDEQPFVIRNIIQKYQDAQGELTVSEEIKQAVIQSDRIYIVACGTSYHAGLVAKEYFEKWAKVPTEVHIASEFGYNMPLLTEKPLFIFISQSGETADSRHVLKTVSEMGYKTLTVTNVPGSTLSREADYTMLLHAGPEIAVASTKAYTAQIAALSILANSVAKEKRNDTIDLKKELSVVANAIGIIIDEKERIEKIAHEYLATTRNAFFIGRSFDNHVGIEAALKLKEISYIQAEGFAGGELKHGTIALIEKGTPVIALATQANVNLSIRGNVKEVAARGAHTCIISMEGLESEGDTLVLPHVHEQLTPLVSVIPTQLLAYYAALQRGCDIDKPRNLAKSVTVE